VKSEERSEPAALDDAAADRVRGARAASFLGTNLAA
jgi:hypothetical protein